MTIEKKKDKNVEVAVELLFVMILTLSSAPSVPREPLTITPTMCAWHVLVFLGGCLARAKEGR